jgi:hypothetical protein
MPGEVVPGAAAQQPFCLVIRGPLVDPSQPIPGSTLVAAVPLVLAPLPHIAVHVLQAPCVGREAAHIGGLMPVFALRAFAIGAPRVVVGSSAVSVSPKWNLISNKAPHALDAAPSSP